MVWHMAIEINNKLNNPKLLMAKYISLDILQN